MADAAIAIGSSDPFGLVALNAAFKPQSVSNTTNNSYAVALNAVGDLGEESAAFDIRNDYSAEYKYVGSDLIANLSVIATALWCHPAGGAESAMIAIESIALSFSAAEYVGISITGHQHGTTLHNDSQGAKWDWSGLFTLISVDGFGIPLMKATTHAITHGSVSATTELGITIGMTHIDAINGAGVHYVGSNNGCRVDMTASGLGNYTDVTVGESWLVDSSSESDSNAEHDTWAVSGHLYLART